MRRSRSFQNGEKDEDTGEKEHSIAHWTAVFGPASLFAVLCGIYRFGELAEVGGLFQFAEYRKNFVVGFDQLWDFVSFMFCDFTERYFMLVS